MLPPPTLVSRKQNNTKYITSSQKSFLKLMDKKSIFQIYKQLEDPKQPQIKSLSVKLMKQEDVGNTLNNMSRFFFNFYKNTPPELDRELVIIRNITYDNGEHKSFPKPIYFFKSTGTSRGVDIKDIWFPTASVPFEISMKDGQISRITKLENKILLNRKYNDKNIDIDLYGRFLTLENALISKYLYDSI